MAKARLTIKRQRGPGATRSLPKSMVPSSERGRLGSSPAAERRVLRPEQVEQIVTMSWALFRAIRLRADAVSVPKLVAMDLSETASPATDSALQRLLDRPNDWFGWPELASLIEFDMCTSQNGAFLLLDNFDDSGRPGSMWRMNPAWVEVVPGTKDDPPERWYIKNFIYSPGGDKRAGKPLDPEQVVWVRVADPYNEYGNQAVVLPAIGPAMLSIKAMMSNRSMQTSGLTGAGIIRPSDGSMRWTSDQMDQIAAILNETLMGEENAHRWALINSPDLKIEPLEGMTPRDMQFQSLVGAMDRAISQATGVPFPLVDPSEVILSNAKQARAILFSNTVVPQLTRLAAALNRQLVDPFFSDECSRVVFDMESIPELADDIATRWSVDSEKLGAILDLGDRVRSGEITLAQSVDLAVEKIGITAEFAARVLANEPGGAEVAGELVEAGGDPRLIEVAIAIIQGVSAGQIPAETGQALVDITLGGGVLSVTPEAANAEAASGWQEPPIIPLTQPRPPAPRPAPRARSHGDDEWAVRGDRHRREYEHASRRASVASARMTEGLVDARGAVEGLATGLASKYSPERLVGRTGYDFSGDPGLGRQYTRAVTDCVRAATDAIEALMVFPVEEARADAFRAAVRHRGAVAGEALANCAIRASSAGDDAGQRALELFDGIVGDLGFWVTNMLTIESSYGDSDSSRATPRSWRPLRWLTELDSRVRPDHEDAHGRLSEYDDEGTGHVWQVGDGFCQWPGQCSDVEQEYNCRCIVTGA